MTASDLKARMARESRSWSRPKPGGGTALLEQEPECPPRLCLQDLKDPEGFHRRLVDWLMKQR